jgi:hypothetical protein
MQGDALLRTCGSLVFPFRCCLPLCLRGAACLHILVCLLGVLLMLLLSVFGQGGAVLLGRGCLLVGVIMEVSL